MALDEELADASTQVTDKQFIASRKLEALSRAFDDEKKYVRELSKAHKQAQAHNDETFQRLAKAHDKLYDRITALETPSPVVDHAANIRDIILKDGGLTVREEIALYIQTCRDLKLL